MDNEIVSAVLIAHHKDKKELAMQNIGKGKDFSSAVIRYTGELVKRNFYSFFRNRFEGTLGLDLLKRKKIILDFPENKLSIY